VERNLVAAQYRYASVAVSSLSILGLLGLAKSTVKVALGLEKCKSLQPYLLPSHAASSENPIVEISFYALFTV
jgi:hypothetical protein